ncbi:MAG: adenylate/guanylate cyclase domain-containing protein [Sandaracinaceae bacterium]
MSSSEPPSPAASEPRAPRFPFRLKLSALAAALTLVPLPALGLTLASSSEAALAERIVDFHLAVADEILGATDAELARAEDGLDAVGRLLLSDALSEDDAIAAVLRTVEGAEALDQVAIYDADGALIDVVRESASSPAAFAETLPAALRARAAERGAATGPPSAGDGAPSVLLVIPMRAQPVGPPHGYAVSHVSLFRLRERIDRVAGHRLEGRGAHASLLDADGRSLMRTDGDAHLEDLSQHPLLHGGARPDAAIAEQRSYERDGETYLGTLSRDAERGWAVIVEVPTRTALAPVASMRRSILIAVAIATVLALAIGLGFARSISRPIGGLVALARRLGRRELGATVDVATSDELATLADAMSRASVDLAASEARIEEERAIRSDLGRYVAPQIVERVVRREQDMQLGGERRTITVLFADVVGFTPLSEERDPEVVVTLLNELFTILTELVFRHGGTVDKFVGDSVMAMWNAPVDQPDHAARALRAASDMLEWVEIANLAWADHLGVTVELAIGVHTGDAVVGNVGSKRRMTYTAIGDVVNVAARLESIARPQQILTSDATREAAGREQDYRDGGVHVLAGRREPLALYEVVR